MPKIVGATKTIPGQAGIVTIRTGGYQSWTIRQITTVAPAAPIGATCKIKRNGTVVVPFMIPTGDVADGEPPIYLTGADVSTVEWTGFTGATEATIVYDVD